MNDKCLICNKKFKTRKGIARHVVEKHNMTFEEYIIKFFYNNIQPLCKCGCKTKLKFRLYSKNNEWFAKYTRNHQPRNPHTEETKQKIKDTYKKTMLRKYGVENPMLLKIFRKKIKETKLKRYNNENYNNIVKCKKTKLERYNNKNYNNQKKRENTNLKKYGVTSPLSLDRIIKQSKNTKLQKYDDENYNNILQAKKTKLKKYGYECEFLDSNYRKKYNIKTSIIEIKIANELFATHKFIYKNKEFDMLIENKNIIIEIDGDFWHPSNLNNLTITQLNSVINDKQKIDLISKSIYKLYKIHISNLPKNINLKEIISNSYIPDYSITYKQKIMNKEYFKKYIDKKGKNKLKKYISLLLKFIREFQPDFPIIPTNENIDNIIKKIQNYDLSKILINNNTIFRNNCSNVGVNYLKSHHKSYWNSSYKGKLTPVEAWRDDKIMKKIIEYRIGINNSNEIFDFSLHQLIRGLSARRYTISFFKPLVASAIYKYFLGNIISPVVIDPCAGFGGRMIGFKAIYPKGTYIGIEPNIETYNELVKLSKNFTNIKLYNCKLEDYTDSKKCDLTFTSIPYFDLETYSNSIKYKNINNWQNTFIEELKTSYNNLIINLPIELEYLFSDFNYNKYFLQNNTSHFDKNKNKKSELILDLR